MSFVWEHGWNECFFCGKAKVQHKMHSTGFHRPFSMRHDLRGDLRALGVRWADPMDHFAGPRFRKTGWALPDAGKTARYGKTVWITSNRSRPWNLEGRFRLECRNQQVNGRNSMTKSAKHGKFDQGPPFHGSSNLAISHGCAEVCHHGRQPLRLYSLELTNSSDADDIFKVPWPWGWAQRGMLTFDFNSSQTQKNQSTQLGLVDLLMIGPRLCCWWMMVWTVWSKVFWFIEATAVSIQMHEACRF